mmetsp:Transcript_25214/g.47058  ORF Transcript_25214/g.47058 Transcript_25214/m.47058 type:complete len:134 (-) Transcript_25214:80-481(-)
MAKVLLAVALSKAAGTRTSDPTAKPEPYPSLGTYYSWVDNRAFMGDPFHSTLPMGGDYPPRVPLQGARYMKRLDGNLTRPKDFFGRPPPQTDYNAKNPDDRGPIPGLDALYDNSYWRQPMMVPRKQTVQPTGA